MASLIYFLCSVTSVLCAGLLGRAYVRSRTPLLFWTMIFFVSQAINNTFLFIDLSLTPTQMDLSLVRYISALVGVLFLLYGFVKEAI